MDREDLKTVDKVIVFLDKISAIPLLAFTIVYAIFSLQIIFDPLNWQLYFSAYLLGTIIGLVIYLYDRNVISQKIEAKEYDTLLVDTLCWGILGCILYGLGVIILIKWFAILIYCAEDYNIEKKENYVNQRIRLGLKNSFNNFAARAGLTIILLYLYFNGTEIIITTINQVIIGNLEALFDVYIVTLLIALIALLSESHSQDYYHYKEEFSERDVSAVCLRGILACLFSWAGIFILFKVIAIGILPESKLDKRYDDVPATIHYNEVIYSHFKPARNYEEDI